MAGTSSKIQYHCHPHPLPVSPIESTSPDEHFSQKAASNPSLHYNSLLPPFSQPAIGIHHPLPPRPPAVVPSCTTDRINGHSTHPKDYDRAFDVPVSATRGKQDENRESLICVPAKKYSDQDHPHETLPDHRSQCQSTTVAAHGDPMASTDPSLEIRMSESRAAPIDFRLDSADRAVKPSEQQLSSIDREHPQMSILGNGARKHILNVRDGKKIDSHAVLGDSTRATAGPSAEWSQRKRSPSAGVSSPQTLPVVVPAPSRSTSLRRSPTRPESSLSHRLDPIDEVGHESSGALLASCNLTLDYPSNMLAATKRTTPHRDSCNSPVGRPIGEGRVSSPGLFTIRNDRDGGGYRTNDSGSASASRDSIFSRQSEERCSGSITSGSPDSIVDPGAEHPGFPRAAVGQSRRYLRPGSDGCYLGRSSRAPAKSLSVVSTASMASRSKQLGSESEDSESASDTDDEHHHSGDDRWQFRRIVARRMDLSGRRMALVEWENTWEPEDELGGLKRALRRYAQERQAKQVPATETALRHRGRKRKCPS